jgi:hypothetical protein
MFPTGKYKRIIKKVFFFQSGFAPNLKELLTFLYPVLAILFMGNDISQYYCIINYVFFRHHRKKPILVVSKEI